MGYRLQVVADTVQEAVRHAGGLMFDRRRAGWDVVVTTPDVAPSRALTILGARAQVPGLSDELASGRRIDQHTVVASARGFSAHGLEVSVMHAQVLHWGQAIDGEREDICHPVHHGLSDAAQAFKGYALRAAGLFTGAEPVEHFWAHPIGDAHVPPMAGSPQRSEWAAAPSTKSMRG